MPNGHDKNLYRLSAACGEYRERFGAWPAEAALDPAIVENLRWLLTAGDLETLNARLRLTANRGDQDPPIRVSGPEGTVTLRRFAWVGSCRRSPTLVWRGGSSRDSLGTTKRTDGQTQVTYDKHPLYYFRGYGATPADKKAGDLNGQTFAGLWYVVSPKGAPITSLP